MNNTFECFMFINTFEMKLILWVTIGQSLSEICSQILFVMLLVLFLDKMEL